VSPGEYAAGQEADGVALARSGLLIIGERAAVSPRAVFMPADARGTVRPVEIGPGCQVGAYAVIYGGTVLREEARVEEYTIVGKPERGYAVQRMYSGEGCRPYWAGGWSSGRVRSCTRGLRSARTR
jgi:hypothetical protein